MDSFPILEEFAYANHAAMGPWPRETRDAVVRFADENLHQGPMSYSRWLRRDTELRERVARLLNAPTAADISLLSNTSEGIGIVANGMDWQAGDNIVTACDEFISNQLAWEALSERGVELRRVDLRAAEDAEAALAGAFDERTRLLTISSVQWDDGFRLNLQRLGRYCRDAGVLFFVDAIQEFGALPMDVQADQIDYLAAGSHKWQMGPEGMGVFYCRATLRPGLRLVNLGWRMLDDPYRYDRPDREPSDSGIRFEGGSPNSMGQVALHASLGVLEAHGMERVGRAVLQNTDILMQGLSSIPGVDILSRTEAERRSGIVQFRGARPLDELMRGLKKRKVACALRGAGLRLSPHYYQLGAPLQELLNRVEDAIKS